MHINKDRTSKNSTRDTIDVVQNKKWPPPFIQEIDSIKSFNKEFCSTHYK